MDQRAVVDQIQRLIDAEYKLEITLTRLRLILDTINLPSAKYHAQAALDAIKIYETL